MCWSLNLSCLSAKGELRLPQEKVQRIHDTLEEWAARKWCWRRELESLVGTLQSATKVIPPGKAFLRRISDHLRGGRCPWHHIRLNRGFKAHLQWWQFLIHKWNGVIFLQPHRQTVSITSDASGSWGCGAYSSPWWFQLPWPASMCQADIAVKELVPIILAVVTWGPLFRGAHFLCYCDNQAVVAVVNSRDTRHPHLLHLLRCLFLFEARLQLQISATYIAGRDNVLADDLSRNKLFSFFSQTPDMMPHPSPLPLMAQDLLFNPDLDWASGSLMALFNAIVP